MDHSSRECPQVEIAKALTQRPSNRVPPSLDQAIPFGAVHARFKSCPRNPCGGDGGKIGKNPELEPGQKSGALRGRLEHQRTLDGSRDDVREKLAKPIVRRHPSIHTKRAWRAAIARYGLQQIEGLIG